MRIYNNWFLLCMALILSVVFMIMGFSMGQQSSDDDCQRFGMFHHSGNTYTCHQVGKNSVVAIEFREVGK